MPKVIRKIIKIDEEKCDGCGLCIPSCKEGALQIVDGKARLVSDVYCDGLGACLGECPRGAITIEEREAEAFDETAVEKQAMREGSSTIPDETKGCSSSNQSRVTSNESPLPCGCPGTMAKELKVAGKAKAEAKVEAQRNKCCGIASELTHWPVQLALIPVNAPYLKNADLLLLADCTAVAYANLHHDFIRGRVVAMACPKLDNTDPYVQKLAAMIQTNDFRSIEVVMMEVPCCAGLFSLVQRAAESSGVRVRIKKTIISLEGGVREDD
ncbi:MAG TPA: 4Fe-4S binding protein [bacterium]|nr:4Fe-4S binding protein [Myxococcales bacterium]HQC50712.1 4Fe-4S binding protein [bacterium]